MRARDNPFATARVHRIRYRLQDGLTWEELLGRVESMNWRASIVGPEGAGKTTLLEDFAPRLCERGFDIVWLRLTREKPRISATALAELSAIERRHFILFDGAEQLNWWSWRAFLRRVRPAGGLLVTSHRSGLLPTLLECGTCAGLLAQIVAELLRTTRQDCASQAELLFDKHRGNLREALREMYDLFAEEAGRGNELNGRIPPGPLLPAWAGCDETVCKY